MLFDYERDEAHHRLTVTYRGDFSLAEVLAILERIRADGTWSYPVLYDLRRMNGYATPDEFKQIMAARDEIFVRVARSRGPIAFVVSEPGLYAKACAYAALGRSMMSMQVFRDRDEALHWLDEQPAEFRGQP